MDKMLEISEEAITRYFTTLSQFGYKKYSDVDKIIILFFMEEMLAGEMSYYVTQDDYRSIVNALYCLAGSTCMIDFPMFESYDTLVHSSNRTFVPRITEDSILRSTEDDNFRVEA